MGEVSVLQGQPPGSREAAMVVVRRDASGQPTVWCDPEIADLVDALNTGPLRTVASCSGHGTMPGRISLADGRELIVLKDFSSGMAAFRTLVSRLGGESG